VAISVGGVQRPKSSPERQQRTWIHRKGGAGDTGGVLV